MFNKKMNDIGKSSKGVSIFVNAFEKVESFYRQQSF